MAEQTYRYVIVGGGLAGASAVEGIRAVDTDGSILLFGKEEHLPYDRPPLSKKLWFGKMKTEEIYLHNASFYSDQHATLALGVSAVGLDPTAKTLKDSRGNQYTFEKLLLATGGAPRHLNIPGGDLPDVCYYRTLSDYLRLRQTVSAGATALVIGGGFIGSEIAAALAHNQVSVTLLYPDSTLVARVFPVELGQALESLYRQRGVAILSRDAPVSIEKRGTRFMTHTCEGQQIESDLVIVGIGIAPSVSLAQNAGLAVENGIVVNDHLQTSHPDVYAAGDNAFFPCQALGMRMRMEHWDNARAQGQHAGRNMAGANEPFTYLPFFYSDLFEFGYEAVGEVSASLETFADWQKENDTGVIYYLKDGRVRGVMNCNVWEKLDVARDMILKAGPVTHEALRGAIQ